MAGIGKWKKELKYATEHLPIYDENGDFEYGEGYWECPDCGFKFTESEF